MKSPIGGRQLSDKQATDLAIYFIDERARAGQFTRMNALGWFAKYIYIGGTTIKVHAETYEECFDTLGVDIRSVNPCI